MKKVSKKTASLTRYISKIISWALIFILCFPTQQAFTNPSGHTVVGGSADVIPSGNKLDIHQHSNRAAIDWRSFNIEFNEHTQFHQPSTDSIVLNRVNSTSLSQINGKLTANGHVVIVNPNGIVFGNGNIVDVGGLIATYADIDNTSFMNGKMKFDTPGNPNAKIINKGNIKASGPVALLSPYIENSGNITAKNVHLKSAEKFSIDLTGDGMITAIIDSKKLGNQYIINSGRISAKGGNVELNAAAARELVDSLIENTGIIEAQGLGIKNGKVTLYAEGSNAVPGNIEANKGKKSGNSTVTNSGIIDASGFEPGDNSGLIELLADKVLVKSGSFINTSANFFGDGQGGTINIGGSYQGTGNTPTSILTDIEQNATILANAGKHGEGGYIYIWSDGKTKFFGSTQATGGRFGGNGGFLEISGLKSFKLKRDFSDVSVKTPFGKTGEILFDPTDLIISTAADSNVTGASPLQPNANNVTANLSTATIISALNSGNIIVQSRAGGTQAGNVTLAASSPITWTTTNTLTITANNLLTLNSPITAGGNLTLNSGAASGININSAITANGNLTLSAGSTGVNLNSNISVAAAKNLTITTGAFSAGTNSITGTGNFTLTPLAGSTIGLGGSSPTENIAFTDTTLNSMTSGSSSWANMTFGSTANTAAFNIATRPWFGNLTLNSGGATNGITINGNQTFSAGKNLTISTGKFSASTNLISGTGNFVLTPATGSTIGLGGSAPTENIAFTDTTLDSMTSGSNTWANMTFGAAANTAAFNIYSANRTWFGNLTLNSGGTTNGITISGNQSLAAGKNLTINTGKFSIGNNSLSGTSNLVINPANGSTVGLGGSAPTENVALNDTALDAISNSSSSWNNITFGTTTNTAAFNLYSAGRTWYSNLTLRSAGTTNGIAISGNQSFAAGNNFTISTGKLSVGNNSLSGVNNFTLTPAAGSTIGLGGSAPTENIAFTDTTLNSMSNSSSSWANMTLGATTNTAATTLYSTSRTWYGNVTLNSGTGVITINGANAMNTGMDLTFNTNGDISLGASSSLAGSSTSNLTVTPSTNATTICLACSSAIINFDSTELPKIQNGWNNMTFGDTAMTGTIAVGGPTTLTPWSGNLTLRTNTGTISVNTSSDQSMASGKNLTFNTNADISLNSNLSGTGTLSFTPVTATTTMGLAGGAGTINLNATELSKIQTGWTSVSFGTTAMTGAMNIGAMTWVTPTLFLNNTGGITVSGSQDFGSHNATYQAGGALSFGAAITGTGTLAITPVANGTTIGLSGGAGTLNVTGLSNITGGWAAVNIGSTAGTGAMNINATTWNPHVTFLRNTGVITINGNQTMAIGKNLTFNTNADIALNANLIGTSTGNLFFTPVANATTIGLAGGTGIINLDASELTKIQAGWNSINFGNTNMTGTMNIGVTGPNVTTWLSKVNLNENSGTITIDNEQAFGSHDFTITTGGDIAFNALVNGTANLNITPRATNTSVGVGSGSTLTLLTSSIANIGSGWNLVTVGRSGGTAGFNVNGTHIWNTDVLFKSATGTMTFTAPQSFGSNDFTIETDANPAINSPTTLSGSGNLFIRPTSTTTTIGLAGGAGTLALTAAELGRITDGWNSISFGNSLLASSGAITIGAFSGWNDPISIFTETGAITITGIQNFNANDFNITSAGTVAFNAAVNGTGNLTITPKLQDTDVSIGSGSDLNISSTSIGNIGSTWNQATIGRSDGIGTFDVNSTNTWNSNTLLRSGNGPMIINAPQTMANNKNLTLETDCDLVLANTLTGTGQLTIRPSSATTSIGIAGGVGDLNLSIGDLDNISDGWNQISFGHELLSSSGDINLEMYDWKDPISILTETGTINVTGAQNFGTNNFSITSAGLITFDAGINGTSNLTIAPKLSSNTIRVGSGGTNLNISSASISNINSGWNLLTIGRPDGTGAFDVNAATTWSTPVSFLSDTGTINISATQNFGSNNFSITSAGLLTFSSAINGSGNLTITPRLASTNVGIGSGGNLSITPPSVGNIGSAWSLATIGRSDGTGAFDVNGITTWKSNTLLKSGSGLMTISQPQTMNAGKNLTLETDSDLALTNALSGSGQLTIRPSSLTIPIGITSGAGTLNLSTAEIAQISNGWSNITIGRTDLNADINIGASTWNDPTYFLTSKNINLSGAITNSEISGTTFVLTTTAGNFISTAGSSAINPGGGRYLVYSINPANNILGGINGFIKRYNKTFIGYPPALVTESNNIFLYSIAPVITFTPDSFSRVYGLPNPTFTASYSGFIDGDTLTTATLGTPIFSTSATQASSVGNYPITASLGSLASPFGYQFNIVGSGIVTIIPAVIPDTAFVILPLDSLNADNFKSGESSESQLHEFAYTTTKRTNQPESKIDKKKKTKIKKSKQLK